MVGLMDDAKLTEIKSELQLLESRLQLLERRDAVASAHHDSITTRLDGIEDTLKWLNKLIVGGLLAGLIAFVVQGGLAIP